VEGPRRLVPEDIPRPCYVSHPRGIDPRETDRKREKQIASNTAKEIEIMREACKLGREVLNEAHKACRVGNTTDEVDRVVHEACLERKCYPSPLMYGFFPKSCCTSVNEVVCHGIPDSRPLQDGDIVNVDVSIYFKGMHADLNETYCVGNVDEKGKKLIAATYDCLWKAIAKCKPGTFYRDLGDVITKHAKSQKCSVVRTYCGHGVGELFHCSPTVPHYANNKAVGTMKPGHIFTIEPMINEGAWKEIRWPDDWTSTTIDGKRSAQFEETLLITETGVEVLTRGTFIPEGATMSPDEVLKPKPAASTTSNSNNNKKGKK
jgi:methionyl aminopeptidase